MGIVDSHHHLGQGCVFDGWTATEEEITAAQDRHDVVASVIQPWPGATPDPKKVHDAIAAFARSRPGRIFGMANVNPHYDQLGAAAEIVAVTPLAGLIVIVLVALEPLLGLIVSWNTSGASCCGPLE